MKRKTTSGITLLMLLICTLSLAFYVVPTAATEEEVYSPEIEPYFTLNVTYILEPAGYNLSHWYQMLRMMAQNLADLGIEVHLYFVTMEEAFDRLASGKLFDEGGYDAAFYGWGHYPEWYSNVSAVAQIMHERYHSSNMPGAGTGLNYLMWNSSENDGILDAATSSMNETEIESLLCDWQAFFYEEQPAAVVCYAQGRDGYYNLGFNMLHPVFGTGTDTPLGQEDPTRAPEAAKYVRQAISHTIDREWVVSNIPSIYEPVEPGITPIMPDWPGFDPSLEPRSLNLTEARRLLSLAGYGMMASGASPISLLVTDSQGRRVGSLETCPDLNEIPGAYYSGFATEPQVIYIPWPQGEYTIQVLGTDTGSFTLTVTQVTEQVFTGVVATGTTYLYTTTTSATGAETVSPGPSIELCNAKEYINAINDTAFVKNPDQLRGALNSKIDEVLAKIEARLFEDAANKLANDIYPKVTGNRYDYYASGQVKAWIIDPAIQEALQECFFQIIEEIEAM